MKLTESMWIWGLSVLVFLVAAAIGISSGDDLRWPDEVEYHQIANGIVDGKGYVNASGLPTAHRPPGYPYMIAAVYSIWRHPLGAKLLNAFALALTAYFLAIIVGSVSPKGAVFAPLLVLLNPLFLYTSSTLLPQTSGTLLFILSVYCLLKFPASKVIAAIAGIIYGILILDIPAFLLTLMMIVAVLFFFRKYEKAPLSGVIALFFVCAILAVSPWSIRNAMEFGKFIPVSSNSGENLLLGNSKNAGPNSGALVDLSPYDTPEWKRMDEIEKDVYLRRAAMNWISDHPMRAFNLYTRKVLNYFNYHNDVSTKSQMNSLRDALLFISYYPLLLLVVGRCFLWRRYRFAWQEAMFYLLYVSNAFASAIFFTRIRYRIPFDALLIMMVSIFLGYLIANSKTMIEEHARK